MFTGIIETTGLVALLQKEEKNLNLTIESPISNKLKVDQSVAHNGVCLTVVETGPGWHRVTAIDETLNLRRFAVVHEHLPVNPNGNRHHRNIVLLQKCLRQIARCINSQTYPHQVAPLMNDDGNIARSVGGVDRPCAAQRGTGVAMPDASRGTLPRDKTRGRAFETPSALVR